MIGRVIVGMEGGKMVAKITMFLFLTTVLVMLVGCDKEF